VRLCGYAGFSFIVMVVFALPISAELQMEDAVGLWLFDEGDGTVVNDGSGKENHGTFNGAPEWAEGPFGGALNCGKQGHVLIKDSDSLDLQEAWTVALWVNINPPMERWQTILNKRYDTATNYVIRLSKDRVKWEVMINNGGWVRVADPNPPQGGEWVHLAGVYNGTDTLAFFVDGEQVAAREGVSPPPANNIDLRLGSYAGNSGGIDGMIDETAIFTVALAPEDIQLIIQEGLATALDMSGSGFAKAGRPSPKDGTVLDTNWADLNWKPGGYAVTHDVYVGTDFDDVNEATRDSDLFMGNRATEQMWVGVAGNPLPDGLVPGTTYYWRVDAVNDANDASPWKGEVWSFTVRPLTAWNPLPADTMKFVDLEEDLSWEAGIGSMIHTVYIGADFDAVNDAVTGGMMAAELSFDPGPLESDTTYYWRVDELQFPENVTHKGHVWSFSTLGAPGGVKAEYFGGMALEGEPVLTRVEDSIDHDWAEEIVAGLSDQVSARWTADLEAPITDDYTLITRSDDGVRLWLDGALLIDNWTNHAAADNKAAVALNAGEIYSVRMEWYEDGAGAVAQLSWQSPSMSRRVIPGGALQPPLRAGALSPGNGDLNAPQTVTLSWSAGEGATGHHLYFGADAETVANAATPTVEQPKDDTTYDAGALEWGQTYYWRVDEEQADGTVLAGKVWSFTTSDYLVVDDFESYTDEEGTRLFDLWMDGWDDPDNGSVVGNAEAPFTEQQIVRTGAQSMNLAYDNSTFAMISEATYTWSSPQNWTAHGLTTLKLYVRGRTSNNPAPLYVVLEDSGGRTAVVGNADETRVTSTRWTEWEIPLSQFAGVDVAAIKQMSIGVGNRNAPAHNGIGVIYIDDIQVTQ